ncbi:MAG TPA: glycosyltransferase family 39 protein, partial [Caulobacteraceae bacterium]|nr:glycosyltransferase family 39 protein [Caulobacteraceae bacterium]
MARLAVLFATPVELYPDEAQYWLWSRSLDWGYVSKPPLIAWIIRLTTAIGGDGEAWVRLAAPLVHAGAMLVLYPVGKRLYGPAVGLLGAVLYGLMPAVQVSALFIATDAPMMLFLAL